MSQERCILPLESYRLAQYALQVPCYICDGPNSFDAELCRHCQAPMALAHQSNAQDVRPQMIAAIGPAGAGKTVYLGMLTDMLSRYNEEIQLLARGAFSVTLQQTTMSALARCEFPPKTPNEPDRWNWVHCQVRLKGQKLPLELIIPDMSGEAILQEVSHPHSYPVIRSFLTSCAGILTLVDASRVDAGEKDQDFFTMKLLTYLSELDRDRKKGWHNRPVGVVFTKADECERCFADPSAFARDHAPGIWQHCQERFRRHAFFAAGVAGGCGYRLELGGSRVRVPLRIEPRGIVDPFAWVVKQLRK